MEPLMLAQLGVQGVQMIENMGQDQFQNAILRYQLEQQAKQDALNNIEGQSNMFANYLNKMGIGSAQGRASAKNYGKYANSLGGF